MEHLLRECFVTDPALVTPEAVRMRYEASARPGAHEAMRRVFAGLAACGPGPTEGDLTAVTAPVTLLHGREDRIVPSGDGARLAALLPHADLHVLGGTGALAADRTSRHRERADHRLPHQVPGMTAMTPVPALL